ncbi:MAG TPA: hypothetical protein VHY91_20360 [Pirellulales bacterium]|nr:hypothetical protein [Pirellulales bacterium]
MTAVVSTGEFGDATCGDPNDWSGNTLPAAGALTTASQNLSAGPPQGNANSAASNLNAISAVSPGADLEIAVSDSLGGSSIGDTVGTAVPGEGITYTIVVNNDGSSDADGASIVDNLPSTLSGATFTATQTGDASGFTASGSGDIDDTDVDLPAGSSVTYTLNATVASTAIGTLSNTATVTPPEDDVTSDDEDFSDGGIVADVSADSFVNDGSSATDTDTLTPQVDLTITKTDDLGGSSATGAVGTAVPGEGITYTIVVTNAGPSNARRLSIADVLPSTLIGATFTSVGRGGASNYTASGTGNIDDSDVDLPVGSTLTYTLHATVAQSATGTVANTATVTPPQGTTDLGTGNTSATDTDTLASQADLEITKNDDLGGSSATGAVGAAVPGQGITYTIVVSNDGSSSVTGASIVDDLPSTLSGATFTAAATGGATGFTASGSGNIDDTDVDLPAGSSITYTLTANIASSATGTLSNTATVTPPAGVTNIDADNGSAIDSDTLAPQADLEISKTDNLGGLSATGAVGMAVPGQGIIYTITVTNNGPSDAPNASIVDDLPGTLSGATFTAAATGGATGFTASGNGNIDDTDVDLPAGSSVTYMLTANIASSATGTLSNTATVTPPDGVSNTNGEDFDDGVDLNADDNSEIESSSATDSDTLAPQADLEILKTDNWGGSSATGVVGTAVPGEGITYLIVVTNDGPSDVPGASIVDDLPGTLSGATFTAAATGGATGFTASGSGNIDDTDVNLPAGSSVIYTLAANIASSATGTLSNTATVAPPEGVTNTANDGEISNDVINGVQGDNTNDSSATDTDTLTPQTGLEISKTDNLGGSSITGVTGTAAPGDSITYTIIASNTGPSDATGAAVVDMLPSTLSGATYTAVGSGGASGFTASGSGNIDDTDVDLPAGSTITYTVQATVAPSASGTLSNTATVTPAAGVTNSESENISATDNDTLAPQGDLAITKTDNLSGSSVTGAVGTAVPGHAITYTITVTNTGPSDAPDSSIVDSLPSTLGSATFTAVGTGGASGFSQSGSGSIDDTDVDVPAGSTITYTVQATVAPSASGTLSNTATVTPAAGLTDSESENISATDNDTLAPQVGLKITKSDDLGGSSVTGAVGTAQPGEPIAYSITVTNTGPSNATGAAIVDTLPGTLTGATFTAVAGPGVSNYTASGSGNINDSDVTIPVGGTITYTVHAMVAPSATGTFSNTATVTPPEGVTDGDAANGTATDTDTVAPLADLEITKSDNLGGSSATGASGRAIPGEGIIYTIVVTNAGPSGVTGATIDDTLSSFLTGATYTATASGGATGFTSQGSGSIDDTNVNLPVGSSVTYMLQATVAPAAVGTLSNTATVTPREGVTDGDAANGTATDTDTLAPLADLEITKSDNLGGSSATGASGTAIPGEGIAYTIVVTNAGPSDVTGATINDTLSSFLTGATYTATASGSATGFTSQGSGSIDDTNVNLPAGSSVTYTLQATVAPAAVGTLSNTATVTPPEGVTDAHDRAIGADTVTDAIHNAATTNSGNSSATDIDTLMPQAELEITKTDNLGGSSVTGAVGSGTPGQPITYTIVVTNAGPSNATGATVVDTLPDSLSGATYTATESGGASGFTPSGSGSIDDKGLSLPVGSTITYTVHATITSSAAGTLSSTTTVTTPASVTNTNASHSSATDADKLLVVSTSAPLNLSSIFFTVSALLTGNLTVTGNYAPPPVPHTGLPISQPQSIAGMSLPGLPFVSLPTAAVDNFMLAGGGGGDVELLGSPLDIDLTKTNQGPDPLWNMLTDSHSEDWSSDELIGSLLEKLADVDELSLVSFEFGDDVVSPELRKSQRVTVAKPVLPAATATSVLRGSSELNVPPTASQSNPGPAGGGGTHNTNRATGDDSPGGAGAGSPGATQPSPGATTEQAPPDSSTFNTTHGWTWWLGWGVSAGSIGTLSWVYRWRRRGRVPAPRPLPGR